MVSLWPWFLNMKILLSLVFVLRCGFRYLNCIIVTVGIPLCCGSDLLYEERLLKATSQNYKLCCDETCFVVHALAMVPCIFYVIIHNWTTVEN